MYIYFLSFIKNITLFKIQLINIIKIIDIKNKILRFGLMQLQTQKQKQISISITKIFNWPQSETNCFDLIFYPEDIDTPIIQKSVFGTNLSNSMNLNSLLKITYTQDQKIVILKMIKIKKDKKQVLGQFQIDLDALRQKNVQYFPFGKDQVLQVNLYNSMKSTSSRVSRNQQIGYSQYSRNSRLNSDARMHETERYAHERPSFHQRSKANSRIGYSDKYFGYYEPYDHIPSEPRIKKSFSEKVYNLLQEVKTIKQDIMVGTNKVSKQSQIKNNELGYNSDQNSGPRMKKSMSDSKFRSYGMAPMAANPSFRRQQQSNKTKSQKHRLILRTLNVVPCDEYYRNQSGNKQYKNRVENKVNQAQAIPVGPSYSDYYQSKYK